MSGGSIFIEVKKSGMEELIVLFKKKLNNFTQIYITSMLLQLSKYSILKNLVSFVLLLS